MKNRKIQLIALIVIALIIVFLFKSCKNEFIIPEPKCGNRYSIPTIQKSWVNIPIQIDINSLINELENKTPLEEHTDYEKLKENDDELIIKKDWTRKPMDINFIKNTINLSSRVDFNFILKGKNPLPVGGDYWKLAECKSAYIFAIKSNVYVNENWSLSSKSGVTEMQLEKPCGNNIIKAFASIYLTKLIKQKFNEGLNQLDLQMPSVSNMKPKIQPFWDKIQSPIVLKKDILFNLNPTSFSVSPIHGNRKIININVGMECSPKLVYGKLDKAVQLEPLPQLNINNENPTGFHIELEGEIPFIKANEIVNSKLKDKKLQFKGKEVIIKDVNIYPCGDSIVVKVQIDGKAKGIIYFMGLPYYDALTKTINVTNFDFTIDSKNILVKALNWLKHDDFKNSINNQLHFNVSKQIDEGEKYINEAMNRTIEPNIKLEGAINKLKPLGVYNTAESFKVVVIADGNLNIQIK